jgi:uncharacterized delta-60 repeat protein
MNFRETCLKTTRAARHNLLTWVLAGAIGTGFLVPAGAQTIIEPSFESPVVGLPLNQNTVSANSQVGITGWTVTEGTVELVNPSKSSPLTTLGITGSALAGNQAINLASGAGRSAISQNINITGTGPIQVSFLAATATTTTGSGDASIQILLGSQVRNLNISNLKNTLEWLPYTLTFSNVSSGIVTLTFRSSDDPFDRVAFIDNVSVADLSLPQQPPGTNTFINPVSSISTNGIGGTPVTVDSVLPGNVDTRLDPGTGFANIGVNPVVINKIAPLDSGKLLVGGSFSSYRGIATANFARINADGSLDTNFFHGFGASSRVNDFEVQSDNRILLGGAFEAYNEIFLPGIARILANGEPDPTFTPGRGANNEVRAVALQSDGGIVIGGLFTTVGETSRARIARLLQNGKIDSSFAPGSGFNGPVNDLKILPNGQILAAGAFTSYNTVPRAGLVRINSDGSLDAGYITPFESAAVVEEVLVQPDGKVVAVGSFSLTGSNGRRNMARINTNGSLDTTFSSNSVNSGANGKVNSLTSCADGSLVIVGEFTQVDGKARNRIAKLNPKGFVDTSALLITSELVTTNTVITTNVSTVFTTNFPPDTNVYFGYNSNLTFVVLSTNVSPGFSSVSILSTNFPVTTNNITEQSIPSLYLFGQLGGADGPVHAIAMNVSDYPFIGGAFSTVNGKSREGLARLQSCSLAGKTTATITGKAISAFDGSAIAGLTVSLKNEIATTDANGIFTLIDAQIGTNLIVASGPGFFPLTNSLIATGPGPFTNNFTLSPSITDSNTVRLVMSWGPTPFIMDSHLNVPPFGANASQEIAYTNRGSLVAYPFASLDVDATFGFGPETITITNVLPGIYSYWIHDFSTFVTAGVGTFPVNGAKVEVYNHKGLVGTITPPTVGNGGYWHVLQIDGASGNFAIINSLSNAIPTINTNVIYSGAFGTVTGSGSGAPSIASQPGDVVAKLGDTKQLGVDVLGTRPFSYQWYKNGSAITGANGPTLSLPALSSADSADYQVIVTNILGSVTSRVAQVTVLSSTTPFVFLQPNDIVVDKGATASFEILAGGERPLFYQWRHNGLPLANQTGPQLSLTNVVATNTGNYEVIVANAHATIFSRLVNLSVATPPVITNFTVTPGPRVRVGETVNLDVSVSGKPPFDYIWLFNGQIIPSAVAANLHFPAVQFTNAGQYTVIVTNALGSATNPPVTLAVDSPPIITLQPQNQFQTIGRRFDMTVAAIGSPTITYQWMQNGIPLPGETGTTLSVTNLQQANVGLYAVALSNAFGVATSRLARVEIVLERALLPWVGNLGGAGADSGNAVGVDGTGAVYSVGTFQGTATFGTNTLVSAGRDDIFLVRFSPDGGVDWAKRFGGPGYDSASDIVVTTNGDLFITGSFEGVASFGGQNLTNQDAASFADLFVGRFNNAGTPIWLRSEGVVANSDYGYSIALGGTNLYVAGQSFITTFAGIPLTSTGSVLLARYDLAGNPVWARKSGGGNAANQDAAVAVATDPSGGVYLGGRFNSLTFAVANTNLSNRGFQDGFIAKYLADGSFVWIKQIGTAGQDDVRGLATGPDGLVAVGQFSRTNDFGGLVLRSTGGLLPDAYAASFNSAGGLHWAQGFGGASSDSADDVAIDPMGNIYITGSYQGNSTFGTQSSVSIADTSDIFALRLRRDGTVEFMQQAGGDDIGGESGRGIAVDALGNGVFTGSFRGTLVAGGNSTTSTGQDNAFVTRLVSPPNITVQVNGNNELVLSWPGFWPGFLLEKNGEALRGTNWQSSIGTPVLVGDRFYLTNTVSTNLQFFRLRRP